jgi:glucose-1-phosphate cytidylyltransferase
MSVKVIILCGGYGTRLKEETEFKPKPMVYVGNKPIIWHIMKLYSHYGFNDFILALGYKADYIKDFFLNQKAFTSDFTLNTASHEVDYHLEHRREVDNFTITFVDTGLDTEPGERILRCKEYLDGERFMVTYGDGVANLNIQKIIDFHQQQKVLGTITGVHPRTKYGLVKLRGKSDLVKTFVEKPVLSDWVNGGFMVFEPEALQYFKAGETEHPTLQRLADIRKLAMYHHDGFWYAVDTQKELDDLNRMWKEGERPWQVWKS